MQREKVEVVEVGLRDGLQILPRVVPTADKIAWLDAEHASGIRRFEAASFVPAKLLPQMADAADVVAAAKRRPNVTVAALVPNVKGAGAAIAAAADILVVPVSASEAHCRANVRRTPDEMVDEVRRICVARAEAGRPVRVEAGIATAFGCMLQGDVSEDEVVRIAESCLEAGADEIGLADTVGYANPAQVRRLFGRVRAVAGDRVNSAHFHDTRGTRPRQCGCRARRRHPLVRRFARRARRLSLCAQARAATSPPKISCSCWRRWGSTPEFASTR